VLFRQYNQGETPEGASQPSSYGLSALAGTTVPSSREDRAQVFGLLPPLNMEVNSFLEGVPLSLPDPIPATEQFGEKDSSVGSHPSNVDSGYASGGLSLDALRQHDKAGVCREHQLPFQYRP
jgi:hypothetical protein